MIRVSLILWLSLIATLTLPCSKVEAQQFPSVGERQFPLNQMTTPGTAAQWAANVGRTNPEYFQPVRVSLPTTGNVTFYEGSPERGVGLPSPAQASLVVGRMYRLRVTDVPELPGQEFYPSIELIDRLHPPAGMVEDFPIEFELTLEELEWASSERLVTKVVYLEQPDRVPTTLLDAKERILTIEPYHNVIAEADMLGRPVAIVRIGGRTPDPNRPEPAFFGPGGPVRITEKNAQAVRTNRQNLDARSNAKVPRPGVVTLGKGTSRRMAQR